MKLTDNEKENLIVKTILGFYPHSQGIYLFGSYLTENEWPDSDVDIAILLPHESAKEEINLDLSHCSYTLENVLRKNVDLLNLRHVSTVFQFQIVTSGRLLYTGDEQAVHEFEMLTISLYQKLNEERKAILEEFHDTKRAYRV